MHIVLGTDHGGFALKEHLKTILVSQSHQVEDSGATTLDSNDDYPDFAFAVAEKVAADQSNNTRGILVCRSGGGMIIAANKVKGARALPVSTAEAAKYAVEVNNANIISLAADELDPQQAEEVVNTFISARFSAEPRHARRVEKIRQYER